MRARLLHRRASRRRVRLRSGAAARSIEDSGRSRCGVRGANASRAAAPRRSPAGAGTAAHGAALWFPDAELLHAYRARERRDAAGRSRLASSPAWAGSAAPKRRVYRSYDDAATVAAAAVKLLPLDAAVASGWVAGAGGRDRGIGCARRTELLSHRDASARSACAWPRQDRTEALCQLKTAHCAIGVGGPVGTGKSSLIATLCRALVGRAGARRRDERHLHRRGRPLPALARACCLPSGSSRSRPAAARTRRSVTTSRANLEAIEASSSDARGPARRRVRRVGRRQPHRGVQPRARRRRRSSCSTAPAATTCRARAAPESPAPTCW